MDRRSRRPLALFLPLLLLAAAASAQSLSLVADLNHGPEPAVGSFPRDLLAAVGRVFFRVNVEPYSRELWMSDGTAEGTAPIDALCAAPCSEGGFAIGRAGGVLYWSSAYGRLWRTNGTPAGTFELTGRGSPLKLPDVYPDEGEVLRHAFVGSTLYFEGCTLGERCELWRTDGTRAGTRLVKAVVPGPTGATLRELTAAGGRLFFLARGGTELWTSDGTEAGTRRLRTFAQAYGLAGGPGRLFFFGRGGGGEELWTSDGTAAGTRPITAFQLARPFVGSAAPFAAGGRVYFVAHEPSSGGELWASDGTAATTRRVTDFGAPEPFNFLERSEVEVLGGRLLFPAADLPGRLRLWSTAGTLASTRLVAEIDHGAYTLGRRLAKLGKRVLYLTFDPGGGRRLWATDGTPAGTRPLAVLCSGPCTVPTNGPLLALGAAWAPGLDAGGTPQLWRSDGTPAGTRAFTDLPPDTVLDFPYFELAATPAGKIVFGASTPLEGQEPWASDGTPGGTRPLGDLARQPPASFPWDLATAAGRLFFTACDGATREVWTSDGTPAGTSSLTEDTEAEDCSTDPAPSPYSRELTPAGPLLFFLRAAGLLTPPSLWRTDGTPAGTFEVSAPLGFYDVGAVPGRAFAARAREIWTSDGTPAGTVKAFDLPAEGFASHLTGVGSDLYFLIEGPGAGCAVWQGRLAADGTPLGARRIFGGASQRILCPEPAFTQLGPWLFFVAQDDARGPEVYRFDSTQAVMLHVTDGPREGFPPANLLAGPDGALYYFADTQPGSRALWRSDGTRLGTAVVREWPARDGGPGQSPPQGGLAAFAGRLWFAVDDGVHGSELWTSDGTPEGTALVADIRPGPLGSSPGHPSLPGGLVAAGTALYFAADDGVHGIELWTTDGTTEGTRLVEDLAPGRASSFPLLPALLGTRLLFSADDGAAGRELWELDTAD